MRDGYREWLASQGYALNTQNTQLSQANRLENVYGDLDTHFDRDRFASLRSELAYSSADLLAKRPNPSRIAINGDIYNGLASYRAALTYYSRFRDGSGGLAEVGIRRAALDGMRELFLAWCPDFGDFEQRDGAYWETERAYKDEVIGKTTALIAGGGHADELGRGMYDVLQEPPANFVGWRTFANIKDADDAARNDVHAALGELLLDGSEPAEAAARAAERIHPLITRRGLGNAAFAQVRTLVTAALALARPDEAIAVKTRFMDRAAKQLTGRAMFAPQVMSAIEYRTFLALAQDLFTIMRDEWRWRPRDLWDVQGFLWVASQDEAERPGDTLTQPAATARTITPATGSEVYWLVGAAYGGTDDQLARFLREGIWHVSTPDDRQRELTLSMRPGEPIAIKAAFREARHRVPFDARGHDVSAMRIKARGVIIRNWEDGEHVSVAWEQDYAPRTWYFYTNRTTIWKVRPGDPYADQLLQFVFRNGEQQLSWWRNQPYWRERFGDRTESGSQPEERDFTIPLASIAADPYDVDSIVEEGCFLDRAWLYQVVEQVRAKKNLILQGPPGTGKTWLAKRLGYALLGAKDASRLTAIQFQPSMSYEDFVRGYRPVDGKLQLADGLFLRLIDRALARPDEPHVLVIEEINRGNPSQIFGELLTLLEADKRKPGEALQLAYGEPGADPVYVPENLHVIGTMNLADRSLALVDLALRRRFAFRTLRPALNARWRAWCTAKAGLPAAEVERIGQRMEALNGVIAGDRALGEQFCVGHSFVTPLTGSAPGDAKAWFAQVVETEIGPLLEEYWYDAPEKAREARAKLLA